MIISEQYKRRIQQLAGILTEVYAIDFVKANYLNKGKVSKDMFDDLVNWDRSQNNADLPVIFKFVVDEKQPVDLVKTYVEKFYTRDISRKLKNISSFKDATFIDFTREIDDAAPTQGQIPVQISKKTDAEIKSTPWSHIEDEPIFENSRYIIFHPDPYESGARERCMIYGGKYKYCVSRLDGASNMYISYRKQHAATLYFVFDKNLPEKDPNHVILIDVKYGGEGSLDENIEIRNGDNASTPYGDTLRSFLQTANENISEHEKITENILKHKPKTKEEEEAEERLEKAKNEGTYLQLPYEDKEKYIEFGYVLKSSEFLNSHPNLQYKYVSLGKTLELEVYNQMPINIQKNYLRILERKISDGNSYFGTADYDILKENNFNFSAIDPNVFLRLLNFSNAKRAFLENDITYTNGIKGTLLVNIISRFPEGIEKEQIKNKLFNSVPQEFIYTFFTSDSTWGIEEELKFFGEDFLKKLPQEQIDKIFENTYTWSSERSSADYNILKNLTPQQIAGLSQDAINRIIRAADNDASLDKIKEYIPSSLIYNSLTDFEVIKKIEESKNKTVLIKEMMPRIEMLSTYYFADLLKAVKEKNFIKYIINEKTIEKIIKTYHNLKNIVKNKKDFWRKLKESGIESLNDGFLADNLGYYIEKDELPDFIRSIGGIAAKIIPTYKIMQAIESQRTVDESIGLLNALGSKGLMQLDFWGLVNFASAMTNQTKLYILLSIPSNMYHVYIKSDYEMNDLLGVLNHPNDVVDLLIHMGEKNAQKLSGKKLLSIIGEADNDHKISFIKSYKNLLMKKLDKHDFKSFLYENGEIIEDILKIFGGELLYKIDSYDLSSYIREFIEDTQRQQRWKNYFKIGRYYQQQ